MLVNPTIKRPNQSSSSSSHFFKNLCYLYWLHSDSLRWEYVCHAQVSVCINAANKSIYELNETSLPTWWTKSINWKKNSEQIWLYQIDWELCKPGNDANWTKKPFKYGQNNFLQELILYLFNNGVVSKKNGWICFFFLSYCLGNMVLSEMFLNCSLSHNRVLFCSQMVLFQVIEFVQFRERLQHSHQYSMSRIEAPILQIKQKAANLEEVEVTYAPKI